MNQKIEIRNQKINKSFFVLICLVGCMNHDIPLLQQSLKLVESLAPTLVDEISQKFASIAPFFAQMQQLTLHSILGISQISTRMNDFIQRMQNPYMSFLLHNSGTLFVYVKSIFSVCFGDFFFNLVF